MKEREISLADLLVEILLKWRTLVVWMLVGGILLGAVSYVNAGRTVTTVEKQQTSAEDVNAETLAGQLTDLQLANVNQVLAYEELYRTKEAYREQSVLMQIDPMNMPKAELTFLITAENAERAYDIEKVYEDLISGGGLFTYLAEQHGISTTAVNELVGLEKSSYGLLEGTDTLRVSVVHADEDMCQALAQSVAEYVQMQHVQLKKTLGEHNADLIHQSYARVSDAKLLDMQNDFLQELNSVQMTGAKTKDAFKEQEKAYYDALTGKMAKPETETENSVASVSDAEKPASPAVSKKYVVMGMVLAAFIYMFIVFLAYLLNTKIRGTDDLQELYDIPQLGQIPAVRKKKFLDVVDRRILSLRNRHKRQFTPEEALGLAATGIKMAAGKAALDKVCLVGCDLKEVSQAACESLKEKLETGNVTVEIFNNVLYDAEMMEKLSTAKGAVLVAKGGSTLYDELVKELEFMKRQDIMVLGGVLVE